MQRGDAGLDTRINMLSFRSRGEACDYHYQTTEVVQSAPTSLPYAQNKASHPPCCATTNGNGPENIPGIANISAAVHLKNELKKKKQHDRCIAHGRTLEYCVSKAFSEITSDGQRHNRKKKLEEAQELCANCVLSIECSNKRKYTKKWHVRVTIITFAVKQHDFFFSPSCICHCFCSTVFH